MATKKSSDEDSEEPAGVVPTPADLVIVKAKRQSFVALRRQLSEAELSAPGVQKMLLDEIERLDDELVLVSDITEKFHSADKAAAILQERFKSHTALEIISTASITVGAVALGLVYGIKDNHSLAIIVTAGGVILIFVGLWAKKVKL